MQPFKKEGPPSKKGGEGPPIATEKLKKYAHILVTLI